MQMKHFWRAHKTLAEVVFHFVLLLPYAHGASSKRRIQGNLHVEAHSSSKCGVFVS